MENENSPAIIKETLYDKVFKPQQHNPCQRPQRAAPQEPRAADSARFWRRRYTFRWMMTGFDMGTVINKFSKMLDLLKKILRPDWTFFPKVVSPRYRHHKDVHTGHCNRLRCWRCPSPYFHQATLTTTLPIVSVCRFILALIRTLPTLIIALVCALIFSLGTFSGTVAIAIFTFGIVAKDAL